MENSGGKETVPGVADKLPTPLAGTASNFAQLRLPIGQYDRKRSERVSIWFSCE
jgi:hypothetical protein